MEGLENVEQQYQRRRLKRKCPDPQHGPVDPPGNVPCGTSNQPAQEPLAQPAVANGVFRNDLVAMAIFEKGQAMDHVELPTELEQQVAAQERTPANLVAMYRTASYDDPAHRSSYKVLWTRMYRRMNLIKAAADRSDLEQQFVDIPGPLLTEARINTWLALHGFEEDRGSNVHVSRSWRTSSKREHRCHCTQKSMGQRPFDFADLERGLGNLQAEDLAHGLSG